MEFDITIYIDRSLDLKIEKRPLRGQTIRELRALLAADDPTGQTSIESIGLITLDRGELLKDEDLVTESLGTLEICALDAVLEKELPRQKQESKYPEITDTPKAEQLCRERASTNPEVAAGAELLPMTHCEYRVLQRNIIKKVGSDPQANKVVKLTRQVGCIVFTSGRTWTGPQGGEWVELDTLVEKPGWLLVEGPGFGVPGPILQKVEPGEEPPIVVKAVRPEELRMSENLELRDIVLKPSSRIRDAKEWIALLFGINPKDLMMGRPQRSADDGDMSKRDYSLEILPDNMSIMDAGYVEGDELMYVYLGRLDQVVEGKEPSWAGKLTNGAAAKATAPRPGVKDKSYSELQQHFEALGLKPTTAYTDIKRNYRRLALENHPDKHPDDVDGATARFQVIKAAYEAIRDRLNL